LRSKRIGEEELPYQLARNSSAVEFVVEQREVVSNADFATQEAESSVGFGVPKEETDLARKNASGMSWSYDSNAHSLLRFH
jgi:hypothetical protein